MIRFFRWLFGIRDLQQHVPLDVVVETKEEPTPNDALSPPRPDANSLRSGALPAERRTAEPAISASKFQIPALAPGGEQVVVGEASYQPALEAAAEGRTEDGAQRKHVTAVLVLEPSNPYDPNAIRVDVGGRTVGYIPRTSTAELRPILLQLRQQGRAASCRAELLGGWDRGNGDRGRFGIVLDIRSPPSESTGDEPNMPGGTWVAVTGEQKHQDWLAQQHTDTNETMTSAELRFQDGPSATLIEVLLSGAPVGTLTAKMSERYRPLVEETIRLCGRAMAYAKISKGAKKLEVALSLPSPTANL